MLDQAVKGNKIQYPWTESDALFWEAHNPFKSEGPKDQILVPGLRGLHGDYHKKDFNKVFYELLRYLKILKKLKIA